jgi:hypothetical protein
MRKPQGRHGGERDGAAIAKPKKPEPLEPLWPVGSPYVKPAQLSFEFIDNEPSK